MFEKMYFLVPPPSPAPPLSSTRAHVHTQQWRSERPGAVAVVVVVPHPAMEAEHVVVVRAVAPDLHLLYIW